MATVAMVVGAMLRFAFGYIDDNAKNQKQHSNAEDTEDYFLQPLGLREFLNVFGGVLVVSVSHGSMIIGGREKGSGG
jgi:hypothetical protein